jgi:hypothetical protein
MNIFKRFWRDYHLESIVVAASILLTMGMYLLFIKGTMAKEFIPIASAGFLFVVAQMYGRLKDRRDAKRRRAQDLFLEWHTKDIKESRIYLSRWRLVHTGIIGNLPSLGEIERAAAEVYRARYNNPEAARDKNFELHELDSAELRELHAFRLYQFFERWMLLVKNNDIDYRSADEYMRSYKEWWLDNFIVLWMDKESDEYIRGSLGEIIGYLRHNKISSKISVEKIAVNQNKEIAERSSSHEGKA